MMLPGSIHLQTAETKIASVDETAALAASNAPETRIVPDSAVTFCKVSKCFKIYSKPMHRLIEWISFGAVKMHSDFWALRDCSISVSRGECLGIVGPNGAGKSTLLKILSGTITPTSGQFSVSGQVLSLLELGTGFNPELSGRQNIVETCQLLGFPAEYAEDRMPDIEGFAELGEFFDRPIKMYSSGMYVRLAFSLYAFMKPDVFVVDEALSVGDVAFQRKCYRVIEEIRSSQRTVILVSHDPQAIIKFCTRAAWMEAGTIRIIGDPTEVVEAYTKHTLSNSVKATPQRLAITSSRLIPETGRIARSEAAVVYPAAGAELLAMWLETSEGVTQVARVDQAISICYAIRFTSAIDHPVFGLRISNVRGEIICATNSQARSLVTPCYVAGDIEVVRWPMLPGLDAGDYFISCGCSSSNNPLNFLMREVDAYQLCVRGESQCFGTLTLLRKPNLSSQI